MRTKHLIRELKKMGLSKTYAFRLIKIFRKFNFKFSNSRIYYGVFNRMHLLTNENTKYTPPSSIIEGMQNLVNTWQSVSDAFNNFAYFALSLYDTGERAFLFTTGND